MTGQNHLHNHKMYGLNLVLGLGETEAGMENSTFLFVGIDISFLHATTGKSGSCSVYYFTGNLRPTILRDGADRQTE